MFERTDVRCHRDEIEGPRQQVTVTRRENSSEEEISQSRARAALARQPNCLEPGWDSNPLALPLEGNGQQLLTTIRF